MLDLLLMQLMATGASLPFLLALAALLLRDAGPEYRLGAVLLVGLGITNSYLALLQLDHGQGRAVLLTLQPLVIYSIGPCVWLLVRSLLEAGFTVARSHLWHFGPALVVMTGFALFLITGRVTETTVPRAGSPLFLPFVTGFVVAIFYLLRVLQYLWARYCEDQEASEGQAMRRTFLLLTGGGLLVLAVSLVGLLASARFSPLPPILLTTALLLTLFVIFCRNPYLFRVLREAIEEAPYRRCQLTESVADEIGARLQQLMEIEGRYRDSSLSLPSLAEAVGVTPHQLSEYLNQRRGLGFARFLSSYRVAATQEMLLRQPSRAVLDIALEAGFSSKSTFNSAFAEQVGMTPSAWRRSQKSLASNA